MKGEDNIIFKEVVFIGGGHAHVHVLKMLAMEPPENIKGVRFTLITRDVETPYSGMIPGYVAGFYNRKECHVDLYRLCTFANIRFIHATVSNIDTNRKLISCSDGRPLIKYTYLSLDIGIHPKPLPMSSSSSSRTTIQPVNVTPVKPIDSFAKRWERIRERTKINAKQNKILWLYVVGGGAGGCELSFCMYERLKQDLISIGVDYKLLKMVLIQRGSTLLPTHNEHVQKLVKERMEGKIKVMTNTEVIGMDDKKLSIRSSSSSSSKSKSKKNKKKNDKDKISYLNYDEVVWCTQASGQNWVKETCLATTEDGFVIVHPTLQSINTPDVFAVGDIAHLHENPRPKAGVFAVRAGPPLLKNILLKLQGKPLEAWKPQDQFLGIIGTGDGNAIASKGPLAVSGEYIWELKDSIDRKWMAMYTTDLPRLAAQMVELKNNNNDGISSGNKYNVEQNSNELKILQSSSSRCGGCGSKVGSTVLTRALSRVDRWSRSHNYAFTHENVLTSVGDDAAILQPPTSKGAVMVQTVDFFRSFIDDPFIFGQIAACHALSDCHAMNAQPVSALALCTVPYGTEEFTEELLVHMLAGAKVVLKEVGCQLVGGHTCEAAEAALGFSVTGYVQQNAIFPKGPLIVPSHPVALILTKPLGTGALLAMDMVNITDGDTMQNAIKCMIQSNKKAADILSGICTSCTDVTGFGLIGHLVEMLQYSQKEDQGDDWDGDSELEVCAYKFLDATISRFPKMKAVLDMDKIPFLHGAVQRIEAGITSSLQHENLRSAYAVSDSFECSEKFGAKYQLLFDPQTSGGLLATVPYSRKNETIEKLKNAGYLFATDIGIVCGTTYITCSNDKIVDLPPFINIHGSQHSSTTTTTTATTSLLSEEKEKDQEDDNNDNDKQEINCDDIIEVNFFNYILCEIAEMDVKNRNDNSNSKSQEEKDNQESSCDIICEICSRSPYLPFGKPIRPDLTPLRSQDTSDWLKSSKNIIHLKGYCTRIDFENDHVKEMKSDFIRHLRRAEPDLICWDGDEYQSDSFTSLIPEIMEFCQVLAFVRPMYRDDFMKSWDINMNYPHKFRYTLTSNKRKDDAHGILCLNKTKSDMVLCFGGGRCVMKEWRGSPSEISYYLYPVIRKNKNNIDEYSPLEEYLQQKMGKDFYESKRLVGRVGYTFYKNLHSMGRVCRCPSKFGFSKHYKWMKELIWDGSWSDSWVGESESDN